MLDFLFGFAITCFIGLVLIAALSILDMVYTWVKLHIRP